MNIIVYYDYVIGENEIPQKLLLRGNKPPEELIHEYFSEFWADGTQCEEKAKLYWNRDYTEAIQIGDFRVVPDEDYAVLKKYIGEAP